MVYLYFHPYKNKYPDPLFFNPLLDLILQIVNHRDQGEISLVLTNDENIQKLNKTYRQKDKPTDVLSFSYTEIDPNNRENLFFPDPDQISDNQTINGEIFISLETASRQANDNEQNLCSEITRLFTHGVLHLLGFDHEIREQKKSFFRLEQKILNSFQKQRKMNIKCIR